MRITADATIAAAAIIMTVTAIIVPIGAVSLSFESGEVGAWLSLSEGAVTESVSLSTLDSLSSSGMGAESLSLSFSFSLPLGIDVRHAKSFP